MFLIPASLLHYLKILFHRKYHSDNVSKIQNLELSFSSFKKEAFATIVQIKRLTHFFQYSCQSLLVLGPVRMKRPQVMYERGV